MVIRDWLAERIPWMQFPRQILVRPTVPWERRALIALGSLMLLLVGTVVLVIMAILVWAVLR